MEKGTGPSPMDAQHATLLIDGKRRATEAGAMREQLSYAIHVHDPVDVRRYLLL